MNAKREKDCFRSVFRLRKRRVHLHLYGYSRTHMTPLSTPSGLFSHLEGLDEGPQERSDALPSAEQLDQSHDSKQTEECDGDASAVLGVLREGERERWNTHSATLTHS